MCEITDNLRKCLKIVSDLCRENRPLRLSIPLQESDEDIVFNTSIQAAIERIEYYESEKSALVDNYSPLKKKAEGE